ncbi:MAG: DUF2244 domain-containing protein [Pseudomonadota bacterium]|nr:DUF2244 domain-containing protein [Pseudomonadota bacterium]
MKNKSSKRFLDLKIYPNKSLTLFTLMVLFLIFFLTTSFVSIYFILIGAWPVSFFLVLDFILLFYAFKSYRKATRIYDRIILNDKLLIINVNKNGEKNKRIIEPTWLRLKVYSNRKDQYLSIISRGKSVNVGSFLNLKELSELAKTIKSALIKRENHLTFDM